MNQTTDVQIDPERTAVAYVELGTRDGKLAATRITEGLRGSLDSKDGSIWTVGTTDIRVNSDTVIEGNASDIGTDVLVSLVRKRDDSLEALTIVPQQPVELVAGILGSLGLNTGDTWRVGTFDVVVDENTDVGLGADQLGAGVLVSVERGRDGSLLALRMVFQELADTGNSVLGTLQAVSGATWTVGGFDIVVDDDTQVGSGADQIGAGVIALVERDEDGSLVALSISVQGIVGTVNSVTKDWTISGESQVITVDEDTNIELGADQVGLVVLVGFERQRDGSLLVLEARIEQTRSPEG